MGGTAISLIYSGWGSRSGAHFNPAVTLTFARLGRVAPRDAVGYVAAQFAGGIAGVLAVRLIAGNLLADASVRYAVTEPGPPGVGVALGAEALISFMLMSVVLALSSHERLGRWTGVCAGLLVATFITVEAPLSGMSMNPARTPRLGGRCRQLDGPVGLLRRAYGRDARGGTAACAPARADGRGLRQAPPPEGRALHLLRVPDREPCREWTHYGPRHRATLNAPVR